MSSLHMVLKRLLNVFALFKGVHVPVHLICDN